MENKQRKNILQVVKFGCVGAFNTLVDYSVFYLFLSLFSVTKSVAQVIASGVAMVGSYVLNRHWTFGKHGAGTAKELAKFITVNIVSMLTVIFVMHLTYDFWHIENYANWVLSHMHIHFVLSGNKAIMFCKLCSSVFSVIVNFLGNKFWVFRGQNTGTEV